MGDDTDVITPRLSIDEATILPPLSLVNYLNSFIDLYVLPLAELP